MITSPDKTHLIHPFEAAGLGKAPFKFISVSFSEEDSKCDFCGKKIKNVYSIMESGGAIFAVGCDCVKKTSDSDLISNVEAVEKKHRKESRLKAEISKIERLKAEFESVLPTLKKIPFKSMGTNWNNQGDYFEVVIRNNSGATKIAYLEKAIMMAKKFKKESEA